MATRLNPAAPRRGLRSTSSRASGCSDLAGRAKSRSGASADYTAAGCALLLPPYDFLTLSLARIGVAAPLAATLVARGMFFLAALCMRTACMRRLAGFGIVAGRVAVVAAMLARRHRRAVHPQRPRRRECIHDFHGEILLKQAADVAQQAFLFAADQRQCQPFGAGAAGTSDAVHVILRDHRQIIVHHRR